MVVKHGDSRQTLPLHTKRRYHACARLSSPAINVSVRNVSEASIDGASSRPMAGSTCSNDGRVVLPAQWLRCPRTPRLQQQRMFAKVANTRACASGSSARSAAVAVPSVRKLSVARFGPPTASRAIHGADERRDEGQGVGAVGTLRGAIDVTILQWPTSSAIHDGPGDIQWLAARLRSRAPASQSPAARQALRSRAGADEP